MRDVLVLCGMVVLCGDGVFAAESHDNKVNSVALAPGSEIEAVVTRTVDGDTLHVKCRDGRVAVVHLHAIDAPERNQSFGEQAAKVTRQLIQGKQVHVRIRAVYDSGELSADVDLPSATPTLPPVRVNTTLVQRGMAWHDPAAEPQVKWLADYQRRAKMRRMGLWGATKQPEAPWHYRKRDKSASQ